MRQLSILIPSIPSRFYQSVKLFNNLQSMVGDKDIEILMLTDNKKRTIGEKCNNLLEASNSKYFCFIHDDDELVSLDEIYEATFLDVDVINYKAECRNSNGSKYIVTQRLGNSIEHNKDIYGNYMDMNRPPFPNCCWHNKYKKFKFPNISYSEDWEWVRQCLEEAKTEIYIDEILFKYNFDKEKTEASTESNEYWKNPNESNS